MVRLDVCALQINSIHAGFVLVLGKRGIFQASKVMEFVSWSWKVVEFDLIKYVFSRAALACLLFWIVRNLCGKTHSITARCTFIMTVSEIPGNDIIAIAI